MSEAKSNQVSFFSIRWSVPLDMTWQNARARFITWLKFIRVVTAVFQLEKHQSGQLHMQAFVNTVDKIRPRTLAINSNATLGGAEISAASSVGKMQLKSYCMKTDTRAYGPWGFPQDVYRGEDLYCVPRPWQLEMENFIMSEPDTRSIIWITDVQGGAGKSNFVKKMCWLHDSVFLAYARTENLLRIAVDKISTAYLVDLTRAKPHDIAGDDLYAALEQIKNGFIQSTKFIPKTVFFKPPHVIVFSNCAPRLAAMSGDRWKLWSINALFEIMKQDAYVSVAEFPRSRHILVQT